ncbi:MAG: hypothetical protein JSW27_14980, partial [Phycisphaerales bacterium]
MSNVPKQIVIDKDAFTGIKFDDPRSFAQSRLLLLSDTLLYECGTATRQPLKHLLRGYEDIIKAGAYYCSMSRAFVEWECRHCRPYSWFLPDLAATEQIRRGERCPLNLLRLSECAESSRQRDKVAEALLNSSKK